MFKNSLFRRDIPPHCSYCQLGKTSADGTVVYCPRKGVMSPMDSCKKFVYEPTKREPLRQQKLPDFTDEDFSL